MAKKTSDSFKGKRFLTERVKTAKGRKTSSTLWLQRQLNDPYVIQAQEMGYRSRAAFKLLQLNEKYSFLKTGARVVDLGAAPGGWVQVAVKLCNSSRERPLVVGVDLQEIDPIPGAVLLQGDFLEDATYQAVYDALQGPVDVVLSDMAASSTGHRQTDHLKIMALAEIAAHFATEVLKPGGTFVAKVLQGGTERDLLDHLKKNFHKVVHCKPAASRKDSAEMYVVALEFKGSKK